MGAGGGNEPRVSNLFRGGRRMTGNEIRKSESRLATRDNLASSP